MHGSFEYHPPVGVDFADTFRSGDFIEYDRETRMSIAAKKNALEATTTELTEVIIVVYLTPGGTRG